LIVLCQGMSAHLGSVFRHRFRFGSKHPYHHKFLRVLNLRFYEAYLTFLYIGIKVLFLTNVTIQASGFVNKMKLNLRKRLYSGDEENYDEIIRVDSHQMNFIIID
jgi:hypothetical protein